MFNRSSIIICPEKQLNAKIAYCEAEGSDAWHVPCVHNSYEVREYPSLGGIMAYGLSISDAAG